MSRLYLASLLALYPLASPASAQIGQAPARLPHQFLTLAISLDGARIASLETDPAPGGGDAPRALVVRDATTGAPTKIALPCGDLPDCAPGAPAWSPDGKRIAFALRMPGGHARSIYTVDASGHDLTRIAEFTGTVITLRFSAHGDIAVLAIADADKEAGASKAGAELGETVGDAPREQRIGVVENGGLRWASPPGLFVYEYDWRPDASGFVGTASPGDGDANWWSAKLYAFDAGAARVIYTPRSHDEQIANPKVTSDGAAVAFIAGVMSDYVNPGGDAYLLPLAEHALPRPLTPGLPATVTALVPGCHGELVLTELARETTQLVAIDPVSGARRDLWQAPAVLHASEGAVSLACGNDTVAGIRESITEPPEIVVGPIGDWRPITRANEGLAAQVRAVNVAWQVDGLDEQGWLMLPTTEATRPRAMITVPHGGPAASYQPAYFGPGPLRALVEHGYAVFLPNPRGSYGQGEAFTRANIRDFGHGDYRDIMAGVDAALRLAPLDPDRLGITGTSYGGFMTMWSVTRTRRFRAAVARAGISDWQSYYGQTGIGGWMAPYFGASVYDDPNIYARSSPIAAVLAVRTPTLMLVGDRDIECPPAQSLEFWHALHELGVPTSLQVYPDEGHVLRQGKNVADAEARMVAWFDRYLK